ncbi:flavin reductase family protein [Kitasatospora purpeofusca]|uniref:flavin reductase family protein n=1 Tax=Kitasatospora purpeofusca TaxID=67352 RepID=UPI00225A9CC3|nr:flavin reductase family protein [Kitasatospora purpeofusca]MCX4690680.1 flavin reductase family protein [Kitasatospora purpeofusca]
MPPNVDEFASASDPVDETPQDGQRAAFAALPTGVTVLTTTTKRGPAGMTASAVSSLSLDPPLVLLCLTRQSQMLKRIHERQAFVINILPAGTEAIATAFAAPGTTPEHRFAGIGWHEYEALPVLTDALALIACTVETVHPGGDHMILIGRSFSSIRRPGEPLVRHAGSFRRLS